MIVVIVDGILIVMFLFILYVFLGVCEMSCVVLRGDAFNGIVASKIISFFV